MTEETLIELPSELLESLIFILQPSRSRNREVQEIIDCVTQVKILVSARVMGVAGCYGAYCRVL
jgi:hypothetical protein